MKLIAFLYEGVPTIGSVESGRVFPIAPRDSFFDDANRWLAEPQQREAGLPLDGVVQVPAVRSDCNVVCVGLNYRDHAHESGLDLPPSPSIFGRWVSTLSVDGAPVSVPACEAGLDWEVELAVIIGTQIDRSSGRAEPSDVLAYSVFNDISARGRQFDTSQWTLGKNADSSGPLGPVLVTADEFHGWPQLDLELRVNGQVRQTGNTGEMIHSIPDLIAYVTQTLTLRPGDLIATGTPSGVGFKCDPPVLLHAGDMVEAEIESIGVLRTPII